MRNDQLPKRSEGQSPKQQQLKLETANERRCWKSTTWLKKPKPLRLQMPTNYMPTGWTREAQKRIDWKKQNSCRRVRVKVSQMMAWRNYRVGLGIYHLESSWSLLLTSRLEPAAAVFPALVKIIMAKLNYVWIIFYNIIYIVPKDSRKGCTLVYRHIKGHAGFKSLSFFYPSYSHTISQCKRAQKRV